MELLAFLEERIELSEALQRQLVRDLDVLGLGDVSLLELSNLDWVSRAEQANLTFFWHHLQDLLHYFLELSGNEPIDLIQDAKLALVESSLTSRCQIKDPTRRGDNDMNCLPHSDDILVDSRSTRGHHALDTLVFPQFFNDETRLHRQLSHRHENQSLDLVEIGVNFLDERYAIGSRLTRAILSLCDDVLTVHDLGDGLLLDR